ncbi:unnamed protein product [Schistosoma rodhaini]|uniref:Tubulin-folding cofactor D ARM repeats domain-containing protein n=1 Tax=Schistosoma rodhaini TaxID=6188 RepID=A0AA85EKG8_9TREM|nr:unnamed protein product [Schistosoma rodhaini]
MPHTVDDIEPTLSLRVKQDVNDSKNWETRYVLILWLSILVMVPFNLESLDSFGKKLIIERDERTQEAAAFLLAHTVTRPDALHSQLPSIISSAIKNLTFADVINVQDQMQVCGTLRSIANICKLGSRTELLPYASDLLRAVLHLPGDSSKGILLCRLETKVLQRIGLLFCPPINTTWQYQRGSRSLQENLESLLMNHDKNSSVSAKVTDHSPYTSFQNNISGDISGDCSLTMNHEFPNTDEVAEVIDKLISALRSQFTGVRWSAAKGIGRICSRLSSSMVNDVLSAVLSLCTKLEPYTAWHGACLALAELGRRNLLLPSKLPEVIPVVLRALFYDERSGDHNYGSNVRDAGCYVCWAFARAYHPKDFLDYVVPIASSLVLVSLFDREVSVRRAASAAFQENVGRQVRSNNNNQFSVQDDREDATKSQFVFVVIVVPLFKFLDLLLNDPIFNSTIDPNSSILLQLMESVWNETKLTKDVQRIKAAIDIFGGMLQFTGSVRKRSLSLMMIILGSRYPVIRKATATELYEGLLVYELCPSEVLDQVSSILTETIWEGDIEAVRPIRNQLCELFQVPVPRATSKTQNHTSPA